MQSLIIEISELRDRDGDQKVKDLTDFLKDRVKAKINVSGTGITLRYEEGRAPSKAYLRVLLRKFLHKAELKEQFRVISGKENTFIIKERKRVELEEE
ncbi:MAG: hypothetical protein AOA65_1897 [Candidatus Bathyarchaeota archaeon BA1]|nr:MAG: hypothetical protein AOA65_1897 [Candidatus Bathyarchaeota archaeon BA1]